METSEDPEPVYVPVHTPLINNCSYCSPRYNPEPTAFYLYPCGRTHLAHKYCFIQGFRLWRTPCDLCVREGFASAQLVQAKRVTTLCLAIGILVFFLALFLLLWHYAR